MTPHIPSALGAALRARGLTATQVGRAVCPPNTAENGLYRAGARILDGTHACSIERLGELARALRLSILVTSDGVTVAADHDIAVMHSGARAGQIDAKST